MRPRLVILGIVILFVVLAFRICIYVDDTYGVCYPYPECIGMPPEPPLSPGVYPIDPPICVGCGCSGEYYDEKWVDFNLPPKSANTKVRFFISWICWEWGQTLQIHDRYNQILLEGECWGHLVGWTGFVSTDVARLWIYPCGRVGGLDWGWVRFDSLEFIETPPQNMLKPSTSEVRFELCRNYPNPFNPQTDISYVLPYACHVDISIFNVLGQTVTTLVNEYQTAGHKTVLWDGTDDDGKQVTSGVYFYRIQAGEFTDTKKMTLVK